MSIEEKIQHFFKVSGRERKLILKELLKESLTRDHVLSLAPASTIQRIEQMDPQPNFQHGLQIQGQPLGIEIKYRPGLTKCFDKSTKN